MPKNRTYPKLFGFYCAKQLGESGELELQGNLQIIVEKLTKVSHFLGVNVLNLPIG